LRPQRPPGIVAFRKQPRPLCHRHSQQAIPETGHDQHVGETGQGQIEIVRSAAVPRAHRSRAIPARSRRAPGHDRPPRRQRLSRNARRGGYVRAAHHSDVTACSGSPKKVGDSGNDGRGEHPGVVTGTPGRTAWPSIMQTWTGWPTTMQIARPSPRERTLAPDEFPEVTSRASYASVVNWMQRSGHLPCKVTPRPRPGASTALTSASARQRPARPGLPRDVISLSCPCRPLCLGPTRRAGGAHKSAVDGDGRYPGHA
jgi:hypothetical protein